jgi:hypothetical protein
MQVMQIVDLIGGEHGSLPFMGRSGVSDQNDVVGKQGPALSNQRLAGYLGCCWQDPELSSCWQDGTAPLGVSLPLPLAVVLRGGGFPLAELRPVARMCSPLLLRAIQTNKLPILRIRLARQ